MGQGNYRSTGVQEYRSTGVQEYRSTGVQEYRSTGVQEYRSTGVQEPALLRPEIELMTLKYEINPLFVLANLVNQRVNPAYRNPWGISTDNYPYGPGVNS
jgi:hypothetical protein